jgi:hypothetical protein
MNSGLFKSGLSVVHLDFYFERFIICVSTLGLKGFILIMAGTGGDAPLWVEFSNNKDAQ